VFQKEYDFLAVVDKGAVVFGPVILPQNELTLLPIESLILSASV